MNFNKDSKIHKSATKSELPFIRYKSPKFVFCFFIEPMWFKVDCANMITAEHNY